MGFLKELPDLGKQKYMAMPDDNKSEPPRGKGSYCELEERVNRLEKSIEPSHDEPASPRDLPVGTKVHFSGIKQGRMKEDGIHLDGSTCVIKPVEYKGMKHMRNGHFDVEDYELPYRSSTRKDLEGKLEEARRERDEVEKELIRLQNIAGQERNKVLNVVLQQLHKEHPATSECVLRRCKEIVQQEMGSIYNSERMDEEAKKRGMDPYKCVEAHRSFKDTHGNITRVGDAVEVIDGIDKGRMGYVMRLDQDSKPLVRLDKRYGRKFIDPNFLINRSKEPHS